MAWPLIDAVKNQMPASPTHWRRREGELRSATYCGDDHATWTIEILTHVDIACRELIENRNDELVTSS